MQSTSITLVTNFCIFSEEQRQETIFIEAERFEQQRNIKDRPQYKEHNEQHAKEIELDNEKFNLQEYALKLQQDMFCQSEQLFYAL